MKDEFKPLLLAVGALLTQLGAQTAAQAGFPVVGVYDAFSAEDEPAMGQVCRWYLHRLDEPDFLAQLG